MMSTFLSMSAARTRFTICSLAALTLLAAFTASAFAQDAPQLVNLRPDWRVGQRSRYEVWTLRQQNISISLAGQTQTVDSTLETTGQITWTVKRLRPDGAATCEMLIDWLTITTAAQGQKQVADSRKSQSDNPMLHELLKALTGSPLTIEVAPDGTITKVAGTDAMRRKTETPELVPEDLDFIESASDLATLVGPPPQLHIGGAWNTDFKWTHELGFLHQKMNYSLQSVETIEGIPIATVDGQAKTSLEVDRSKLGQDAPPVDAKLSDTSYQSQILFDLSRHEAVGRNTAESRTLNVTVRLPQNTITRRMTETIRSQTLRIAEE
jgi:hypothetical protein